jgi:hypothetical protein
MIIMVRSAHRCFTKNEARREGAPLVGRAIAEFVFSPIGRCYALGQSQAWVADEAILAGSEINTLGTCYQYLAPLEPRRPN